MSQIVRNQTDGIDLEWTDSFVAQNVEYYSQQMEIDWCTDEYLNSTLRQVISITEYCNLPACVSCKSWYVQSVDTGFYGRLWYLFNIIFPFSSTTGSSVMRDCFKNLVTSAREGTNTVVSTSALTLKTGPSCTHTHTFVRDVQVS